jgi:hypothetical protein
MVLKQCCETGAKDPRIDPEPLHRLGVQVGGRSGIFPSIRKTVGADKETQIQKAKASGNLAEEVLDQRVVFNESLKCGL